MDAVRGQRGGLPWWAWPARVLDRVRPGLAERAADDAAWLSTLPAQLRSLLIPAAVLIPVVFAAARAFDTKLVNAVVYTFRIQDVYIESIPFLVIAGAIGLAAPTLGVLFLASHVVADLVAAFLQPRELQPLATAILGRAVSFWLLYLLVTELPIAVHDAAGWARRRLGGPAGKRAAVAVGAISSTALAWIWGLGAPLLIRPVFTWSDLRAPTANAGWPLLVASDAFALILGAVTLALFAARYLLIPAAGEPIAVAASSGHAGRSLVFGIVVPILLFSSVVTQPIDAIVLVTAVLVARPISSLVLRRAGLALPLATIPRPLRLIAGVAISFAVGFVIVTVLGVSTLSAFFTMVVAMAVSFVLTRVMLDADDFAPSPAPPPSFSTGIGAAIAMGVAIWLFTPGAASADNIAGQTDGWSTAAAAAAAAAGAGGLAAASASKSNTKKPNPAPWYVPDSMAEFFGFDSPPKNPPDPNKPKDPNKPPPGWPKQRPPGGDY